MSRSMKNMASGPAMGRNSQRPMVYTTLFAPLNFYHGLGNGEEHTVTLETQECQTANVMGA